MSGTIEDGASGFCNQVNGYDHNASSSCDRIRNEEPFVARVFLRPQPGILPAGQWVFTGWSGCDRTVVVNGVTECVLESGPFDGVERNPHAFFRDTVAPVMSPITEELSTTVERQASFSFSSTESAFSGTFSCRFDSEPAFGACGSGVARTYAEEGVHTIEVRPHDPSGNIGASVSRTVVVVDTAIASGPAEASRTSSQSATFGFVSGAGTGYMCSLDSAPYASCGASPSFGDLAEGAHSLRVYATAPGGWSDRIPAVRTWTVDRTPPQTYFETTPPALTRSPGATFRFSSNEPGTFRCRLDDYPVRVCRTPRAWDGLAHGLHTVRVWAVDEAGNHDPDPAIYTWMVDRIQPETTITAGPSGLTRSTGATFRFTSDEPGSSFRCQLDARLVVACLSPKAWSGLAQGPHTLKVWARDPAGNVDPTPATRTWIVDTVPPDTTLSGPSGVVASTSATFTFASDEPGSTFRCRRDGGLTVACSSPRTWVGLPAGPHTVTVWARDAAGNLDPTPATRTWTIAPAP
jgi:hypothetical protein